MYPNSNLESVRIGNCTKDSLCGLCFAFYTIQRHDSEATPTQQSPLSDTSHPRLPGASSKSSTTLPALTTYTGVSQGCVLSPFMYTLYTNNCTSLSPITTYLKYSDNTAILFTSTHSVLERGHTLHLVVCVQLSPPTCQQDKRNNVQPPLTPAPH